MIGETTYGKGVGQTPIILSSMMMKRYLYLTVMRYTTPNGTQVDHKGVKPDLAEDDGRPSPDVFDAEWALRRSGAVEKYRDAHWTPAIRKLADNDGFETAGYEGFDDFYGGLNDEALAGPGPRADPPLRPPPDGGRRQGLDDRPPDRQGPPAGPGRDP